MHEIRTEKLWIGHSGDLGEIRRVLSLGINAVVCVAAELPPVDYPRDIALCRFPLVDGTENLPVMIRSAVRTVAEFLAAGVPTCVFCGAGLSRSPAIAACALALVERREPDEVLKEITQNAPHDVTPAFWEQVLRAVGE